jgi:hypothetical protein
LGRPLTFAAALAVLLAVAALAMLSAPARVTEACGLAGPFDFDTLEPEQYVSVYSTAIELAVAGKAIDGAWEIGNGESIDVTYQGLLRGPRGERTTEADTSLGIPPTIYKSIAWIESNFANGASAVPYGGVGPTLRSFDCGYGIGQITTGMANSAGTASARQAAIGTHFLFNIAEGVRILADKWNSAPRFRPIAGTGDPAALEDWYYAIWSYNGFAFLNHPLNPNRDPLRGGSATSPIYHCYDPDAESYQEDDDGAVLFGYGDYTYQERVYGCMRNPPSKNGEKLWPPVTFDMPHFELEPVASAFAPQNFLDCEEGGFGGGCPAMDFATTFSDPPIVTHVDPTAPVAAQAADFLGEPRLLLTGPASAVLSTIGDGATGITVTVENTGSWIAPFRIRTSAPWLAVRHPGDPATRSLDGGVAIGHETEVVLSAASPGPPPRERKAQAGYTSVLWVTLDPAQLGSGFSEGTVWIEPLYGAGDALEIEVTAYNGAEARPFRAYSLFLVVDD